MDRNTIIMSAVTGIAGAVILPLMGFGLAGISAGSLAASWQSSIGVGTIFSTLQSLGATGTGNIIFGSAAASITGLYKYYKNTTPGPHRR